MQNTEACISREVIWRRTGEACCPEGSQWLVASTYPSSRRWCCLGGDRVGWQSDRGNYLGEVTLRWRGVRQHCWGPAGPPCHWQQPTELCSTLLHRGRCTYTILHNRKHRGIHRCTSHVNLILHTHTSLCFHCSSDFIYSYVFVLPLQSSIGFHSCIYENQLADSWNLLMLCHPSHLNSKLQ